MPLVAKRKLTETWREAVAFWQETWSALRLQERYVPLDGLDAYQVTPGITGWPGK